MDEENICRYKAFTIDTYNKFWEYYQHLGLKNQE